MVDFIRKRLQIFVSSTFNDLVMERQSAVEAILTAGHIPAGMELFTSGDESQMEVIKQWIDESDVYLLILGGRYGSVEPTSGKSYTQLEYEYALNQSKPVFSCVITDEALESKVKENGSSVIEKENPSELKLFRELATSKMVKFWGDKKDIKIAIGETLANFSRRDDLKGWVRPHHEANMPALADEIARLSKENSSLRQELLLSKNDTPNKLSFEDLTLLLNEDGTFNYLVENAEELLEWRELKKASNSDKTKQLWNYGLMETHPKLPSHIRFNEEGRAFLARLKLGEIKNK